MRELRPLNLPKLVAERNGASQSSEDLTVKTTACAHASAGSFSSISDVSGPPTPTFSIRGHSRFPSTSSSFTSNATSPVCEHTEILGSSSKLPMPQLPEEPAENEEDFSVKDETYVDPFDSCMFCSCDCLPLFTNWEQTHLMKRIATQFYCGPAIILMRMPLMRSASRDHRER